MGDFLRYVQELIPVSHSVRHEDFILRVKQLGRQEQMLITENPSKDKLEKLIDLSEIKAVKWLKDLDGGQKYYWPADWRTHDTIAAVLQIYRYEKGVVTNPSSM